MFYLKFNKNKIIEKNILSSFNYVIISIILVNVLVFYNKSLSERGQSIVLGYASTIIVVFEGTGSFR